MNYFNDIIWENEFFIDMPDCITDGNDYKEKIENSFKLTNGILQLGMFSWERNNNSFEFAMVVNNSPATFSVKINSDYIDSNGLIKGLNDILRDSGYTGERHFCDIDGSIADFGVAFITHSQEVQLEERGLINRNTSMNDIASEINKDDDTISQENIEARKRLLNTLSDLSKNSNDPVFKQLYNLIKPDND